MMPSTDPSQLTHIEIPAALPWPWQPINPPPERVELPLVARTRIWWFWWLVAFYAVFGVVGTVLLSITILLNTWTASTVVLAVGWLFMLGLTVWLGGMFLTVVADCARGPAVLQVDSTGLLDRRALERTIPWSEVVHAKLYGSKGTITTVRLKLRHAIDASHNPLRHGALIFEWRRQPDELLVPVVDLDVKSRTMAFAILKLVALKGGKIEANYYPSGPAIPL
jgi:hypothetical protein